MHTIRGHTENGAGGAHFFFPQKPEFCRGVFGRAGVGGGTVSHTDNDRRPARGAACGNHSAAAERFIVGMWGKDQAGPGAIASSSAIGSSAILVRISAAVWVMTAAASREP